MNSITKRFFNIFEDIIEFIDPTPLIYDVNKFNFVKELYENKETILKEFEAIKLHKFNEVSPETAPDKYFKNANWNVFVLFTYGKIIDVNTNHCPKTFELLRKYKQIKTALFSQLPPNSSMEMHRGPYKGVIRCLFKLKLEDPNSDKDVGLQILDKVFDWKKESCIIFDDTIMHKAWNYTNGNRAVLFLDIERKLIFPFNILNKLILLLITKNKRIKKLYNFYKKQNNLKD